MESSVHGLSEPDVFAVLALARPPVLLRHLGDARGDAGLSALHVAEDLDGVGCAADVGIDPVVTWRGDTRGLIRGAEPVLWTNHVFLLERTPLF